MGTHRTGRSSRFAPTGRSSRFAPTGRSSRFAPEDFKNGDADKSKVIPQLWPPTGINHRFCPKEINGQKSKILLQCEETDKRAEIKDFAPEQPCCECCGEYVSRRIDEEMDEEHAMHLLLGMFWFGRDKN